MQVVAPVTRKQQIETQATAMFREKGYAASSMRELAARLGIEAASLYSHIKSKEEILQSICFKMAKSFFKGLEDIGHSEPDIKMAAAIRAHFKVIARNNDASAVFFNEWRHLNEPRLSEFLEMRERYEQCFVKILEAGIESGQFKPLDKKLAMRTILSAINGAQLWYRPHGEMSEDEIAQQLSEILINGISNPKK